MQLKTLITKYPNIRDINNCEDEPIRYYPNVQSHGCLIVTDYDLKVVQASENCKGFVSKTIEEILDKPLDFVFESKVIQFITNWLRAREDDNSLMFAMDGRPLNLILHKNEQEILITVEENDNYIDRYYACKKSYRKTILRRERNEHERSKEYVE